MSFHTLRQIIARRSLDAEIEEPGLHDFRRAFGLQCQRNGLDLLTISRLLGHANTTVAERYICQDHDELARGHDLACPVDRMKLLVRGLICLTKLSVRFGFDIGYLLV